MSGSLDSNPLAQHALRAMRCLETPCSPLDVPPFESSREFTAIDEQEHLKVIERLLIEAQKNSVKRGFLGLLNRAQHRQNLLVLEILTNLFNGYRAMRYQTSSLTEAAVRNREALLETLRLAAAESQETNARIEDIEKRAREFRTKDSSF